MSAKTADNPLQHVTCVITKSRSSHEVSLHSTCSSEAAAIVLTGLNGFNNHNSASTAYVFNNGGWYHRKPYRSVAYKTWTVNGVRRLLYSNSDMTLRDAGETQTPLAKLDCEKTTDLLPSRKCSLDSNLDSACPLISEPPTDNSPSSGEADVQDLLNSSYSSCSDNEASDYFSAEDYKKFQQKTCDAETLQNLQNDLECTLNSTCGDIQRFVALSSIHSMSLKRKSPYSGSGSSLSGSSSKTHSPIPLRSLFADSPTSLHSRSNGVSLGKMACEFRSPQEAFAFLKKERELLRSKDFQILRNLYRLRREIDELKAEITVDSEFSDSEVEPEDSGSDEDIHFFLPSLPEFLNIDYH